VTDIGVAYGEERSEKVKEKSFLLLLPTLSCSLSIEPIYTPKVNVSYTNKRVVYLYYYNEKKKKHENI
jgi:hypothetical protein